MACVLQTCIRIKAGSISNVGGLTAPLKALLCECRHANSPHTCCSHCSHWHRPHTHWHGPYTHWQRPYTHRHRTDGRCTHAHGHCAYDCHQHWRHWRHWRRRRRRRG